MRRYHWLALLPMVGLLGGVPVVNRVRPFILGLPFLLGWIAIWVVGTALIMAIVFALDRRHDTDITPTVTPDSGPLAS